MAQVFEINRYGKPFRFNGNVELEPDRLTLVGLTPVGSRAFAAIWVEGQFRYEHLPLYPLPIKPAELLALWQLACADQQAIASQLEAAHLIVSQEGLKRTYSRKGRPLIEVVFSGEDLSSGPVTVNHLAGHYSLKIETLTVEHYELEPLDKAQE